MAFVDPLWTRLVEDGLLTEEEAEAGQAHHTLAGGALDTAVLETRPLSELDRARLLRVAAALRAGRVAPPAFLEGPEEKAIAFMPRNLVERHGLLPVHLDANSLTIVAPVLPERVLSELAFTLGRRVEVWLALEIDLRNALHAHLGVPLPHRFIELGERLAKPAETRARPASHRPWKASGNPAPAVPSNAASWQEWVTRALDELRGTETPAAIREVLAEAGASVMHARYYLARDPDSDELVCVAGAGPGAMPLGVRVPLPRDSLLNRALRIGAARVGRYEADAGLTELYRALGRTPPAECMVEPVRERFKIVGLFVGDHGDEALPANAAIAFRRFLGGVGRALPTLGTDAPGLSATHTQVGPPAPTDALPPVATAPGMGRPARGPTRLDLSDEARQAKASARDAEPDPERTEVTADAPVEGELNPRQTVAYTTVSQATDANLHVASGTEPGPPSPPEGAEEAARHTDPGPPTPHEGAEASSAEPDAPSAPEGEPPAARGTEPGPPSPPEEAEAAEASAQSVVATAPLIRVANGDTELSLDRPTGMQTEAHEASVEADEEALDASVDSIPGEDDSLQLFGESHPIRPRPALDPEDTEADGATDEGPHIFDAPTSLPPPPETGELPDPSTPRRVVTLAMPDDEGLPEMPTFTPRPAPVKPDEPPHPDALRAHVEELSSPDAAEREAAVDDLLAGGDAALEVLFDAFPGHLLIDRYAADVGRVPVEEHSAVLRMVVRFGHASVPHLERLCDHLSPEIRYYAVYAFDSLRAPSALPRLSRALLDKDASVREVAVHVVDRYREEPSFDDVAARLRRLVANGRPTERRLAAEALGRLRAAVAAPELIEALDDAQRPLVEAAHRGLVEITRQDLGYDGWKWQAWFERHGVRPRIEWLLDGLLHEQRAIRAASFRELTRVTHQNYAYSIDAPAPERRKAVERWRKWWDESGRARFARYA